MSNKIEPVLQATGICKYFPGAIALDDVSLSLYPGEVHALLGENGAGKSTLIKCLTGAYKKDAGTIILDGKEIDPRDPNDSLSAGIGTVYQEVNLLPNLTVAENLFLGWQPMKFGMLDQRAMVSRSSKILSEFGLEIDPTQLLSSYSIAIQQVVAIARAVELAGMVLILDEPTASLDRDEIDLLFSVIKKLTDRGLAVVFITHFLDQVFEISDKATVLRNGRVVGTRVLKKATRTDIVTLMLGRQLEATKRERDDREVGACLLELDGFGRRGTIDPFDMKLHEGEVIGLAGLLGSGRSETANVIFGAIAADLGHAKIRDKKVKLDSPRAAIGLGLGLCPEDRKSDGVVGDLSVRENIILSLQARRGWTQPISRAKAEEIAQDYIKKLDIRLASLDMPIRLLSGGNQQKALLARWLATEPDILILDEPTRGIDVGAHAEIIELIQSLQEQGMALIVASSELEELIAYSNRILVLRDRKQVKELQGSSISIKSIVSSIASEEANQ